MGTFLKVVGVIALIWFGLAAVGCTMMMRALSSGAGSAALHDIGERSAVATALQNGTIDLDRLPSDVESAPEVTVTLQDGSTHVLKNSSSDRALRSLIALKMGAASRAANGGSSSFSPYRSDALNQPHFKPGEPMLDPNPRSHYED